MTGNQLCWWSDKTTFSFWPVNTTECKEDGESKPTYTPPLYILSRADIEEAKNTAESPQYVDELDDLVSRQKLFISKAQKTLEFAEKRRDTLGEAPDPERSAVVEWGRKRDRPPASTSSTKKNTRRRMFSDSSDDDKTQLTNSQLTAQMKRWIKKARMK
jgi:hypothetical protein